MPIALPDLADELGRLIALHLRQDGRLFRDRARRPDAGVTADQDGLAVLLERADMLV